MNFIQKLAQRIEYGDYLPVVKYGKIYHEKMGMELFTLSTQLLKGKNDWVLRLDLNRWWGGNGSRSTLDLHFQTLNEIRVPFQQLLRDVEARVTEPDVKLKRGAFEKFILNLVAGKIVRSYGQIDNHPKNSERFKIELFLSRSDHDYWMLVHDGPYSEGEWSKWSIGTADAINRLFPAIEEAMRNNRKQTV